MSWRYCESCEQWYSEGGGQSCPECGQDVVGNIPPEQTERSVIHNLQMKEAAMDQGLI